MKQLLLILIFILSFQTLTKADDIKEFEIEGISVGDSLLKHFTKTKIKKIINSYSDKGYSFKTRNYYSITIKDSNFTQYDSIQVALKDKDQNYIIHMIAGNKNMDIEECYLDFNPIEKEFDTIFKDANKVDKEKRAHVQDESGESTTTDVYYWLKDGSFAALVCTDWGDTIQAANNWSDTFRVEMGVKEFVDWYLTKAW
jgi:hypothetical protein